MDHRTALDTRGFTLVEVLIATGLLVVVSVGVVQLLAVASLRGRAARAQTSATVLAAAKIEELRALAWSYELAYDASLVERSDYESNLSLATAAAGGPGLTASPAGTLTSNTTFYFEYLDANGRWAGNSTQPPPGAAFVRRWAVRRLAGQPHALVLQVLVRPVEQDGSGSAASWQGRVGQEALLTTIRTRRGQ